MRVFSPTLLHLIKGSGSLDESALICTFTRSVDFFMGVGCQVLVARSAATSFIGSFPGSASTSPRCSLWC